jgi:cyclase
MSSVYHDVTTPAQPRVEEVGDGVLAYIQLDGSWWINNTGFLVGRTLCRWRDPAPLRPSAG